MDSQTEIDDPFRYDRSISYHSFEFMHFSCNKLLSKKIILNRSISDSEFIRIDRNW